MHCRKIGLATLSIFLLTLSVPDVARSQTGKKTSIQPQKKPAKIGGFRSAKFGMKENSIYRAISKDFKISKKDVKQSLHPLELTKNLTVSVPNLIKEVGGTATIAYILGYKSKRLIQVNIVWAAEAEESEKKANIQSVVDAANFLRNHLIKKQYQKEGFIANARINDAVTMVFRGKDKKGRMALLILTQAENDKKTGKKVSLRLSYILNTDMPDILTIKEDDF